MLFQQQRRLDFDNPHYFSDDEYKMLTDVSKAQFHDLEWHISQSKIRNFSDRSMRTALVLFLCKIRL